MKIKLFRVDLRRLILWMCLFFVMLALANNLFASYQVQREILLNNSLSANHAYAQKLAHITNAYIKSAMGMLEATAWEIGAKPHGPTALQEELSRTARMTRNFNSIFYSDATGHVLAALPAADKLAGTTLISTPSLEALAVQTRQISAPFLAPSNRWLILLSHPVYNRDGSYAGFVGGTIYLHASNALQNLLGDHYNDDGSYVSVVDQHGLFIYHPIKQRIGTPAQGNLAVLAALRGENGAMLLTDAGHNDRLAGYAPIPETGWAIVVQRPVTAATSKLYSLFWRTLYYSLPITLLSLLGIWWLAKLIARPLRDLAEVASHLDDRGNFNRIHFIRGWYLEAALIRQALLTSFSAVATRIRHLHRETETDPLTTLTNRRGLKSAMAGLKEEGLPLAAVMLDIDHFKNVNDSFGHAAGDETLQAVASLALATARESDIVARLGGEEFVVLLPDASLESAMAFAERLRQNVEQARVMPNMEITVSLGIAHCPTHTQDMNSLLLLADMALYEAKKAGRNCVRVAKGN